MKKILFFVVIILLFSLNIFAYNGTINGILGYFICPTAIPLSQNNVLINTGYIFTTNNFFISLLFSLIPEWELGFSKEINMVDSNNYITPFIFTTKYRFHKGNISASLGLIFETIFGDNPLSNLEVYLAIHGRSIFGKGTMDVVFGKDFNFGQELNSLINLYIGTSFPLISNNLYLIADFSNTTHRIGSIGYLGSNRGVFNIGLQLYLLKNLNFYIVSFDFLDQPLNFFMAIGANLRLKF